MEKIEIIIKNTVIICSLAEMLVSILSNNLIVACWAFSTLVWCKMYYSLKEEIS
jgi:hypothetical protein